MHWQQWSRQHRTTAASRCTAAAPMASLRRAARTTPVVNRKTPSLTDTALRLSSDVVQTAWLQRVDLQDVVVLMRRVTYVQLDAHLSVILSLSIYLYVRVAVWWSFVLFLTIPAFYTTPERRSFASYRPIVRNSMPWCQVTQVKACSRETHSPSRASKTYGHNAFQIIHIHTTVINTAHTVGSDCGYNPGWCLSYPTVSEMT